MREKSYLELTEYNMKTYGESTEEYLMNVPYKTETNKILKQIAQNLAYIADELSELNEWGGDIWEAIQGIDNNTAEMCGHVLPPYEEHREEDEEPEPQERQKCFICGKEIELKDGCYDDGGCIFDSHGNLTMACKDCANLFDAIISHDILGRKVHC